MGLKGGARTGLIAGAALSFFVWFAAAMLKGLITDFKGIWPEWFPGYIVDFILSGTSIVILVLFCLLVGAVVGLLRPDRYELL